jgi:hypothetical protein
MLRVALLVLAATASIPLRADSPRVSVDVSVSKVIGLSELLTRGMRVDALFFAKNEDGTSRMSRRLLLVLRNAVVTYSSAEDRYPIIASLLLTMGQAQAVAALPPAVVELVVTSLPEVSAKAREARHATAPPDPPPPPGGKRHRGADPRYAFVEAAPPDTGDNRFAAWLGSSNSSSARIARVLIWPIFLFLVFKTCTGTLRGARRSRSGTAKKSATLNDV